MSHLLAFNRCVGESPPAYGSRKAFCSVPADFKGACYLHYDVNDVSYIAGFSCYSHAVTAASMAIFSLDIDFQNVRITDRPGDGSLNTYSNPSAWQTASQAHDIQEATWQEA